MNNHSFQNHTLKFCDYSYVPSDAGNLIWDIFFKSKNRGVDLAYHFPWFESLEEVCCLALYDYINQKPFLVGTLVIRVQNIQSVGNVGLVGLVCVHQSYRNQGISTYLLRLAQEFAKGRSLESLILWTTIPKIYEKSGYKVDSKDYFGEVSKNELISADLLNPQNDFRIKKTNLNHAGVPAFATGIIKYSSKNASITVCTANDTQTLVEWSGCIEHVCLILGQTVGQVWKIIVPEASPILTMLVKHGYTVSLQQGAVRMVCNLQSNVELNIPHIALLDRV